MVGVIFQAECAWQAVTDRAGKNTLPLLQRPRNPGPAPSMNPSQLPAWRALEERRRSFQNRTLASLFRADGERARRLRVVAPHIQADLSRHWIDDETLSGLVALARAVDLEKERAALLAGEPVNGTEHRPAWHTALRTQPDDPSLARSLQEEQTQFLGFAQALRAGRIQGKSGVPIETVVCIGIGGSDLGPRLVTEALGAPSGPIRLRFVSNLDPEELARALDGARAESTQFVAISKSFNTLETLENVRAALVWLRDAGGGALDPSHHLAAITAQPKRAAEFGVHSKRIFTFPDWVGGRYSLWSACGFPIAVAHGHEVFLEVLRGARAMDRHFATAPLESNLPVLLGLLGAWYVNFWGVRVRAIFPYAQRLARLPAYLQQLEMESLGKRVDRDAQLLDYDTGPVVWGEVGTSAQHSVFQFLHQGTHWSPADFIIISQFTDSLDRRQRLLNAFALAQADALALGDTTLGAARPTTPYGAAPGGRPSTVLEMETLGPRPLGALLALYEHRTFVQSVLWNINAFDQWGVEVGKKLLEQRLDNSSLM
jgi:glucose-6-phosphate isomerase